MSAQGADDLFVGPPPAAAEVKNPGAESPSWSNRKMPDDASPAATRSNTTTEGVRGFLRAVVVGDLFEDPPPAAAEVKNPGAESPSLNFDGLYRT